MRYVDMRVIQDSLTSNDDEELVTDINNQVKQKKKDMWTEVTKDLVIREAIDSMGYSCEETDDFFYVMEYLRYVCPPTLLVEARCSKSHTGGRSASCRALGQHSREAKESFAWLRRALRGVIR